MASTFDNDLRLEEMATGENAGSWGTKTNTNLELIADAFGYGTFTIADADTTLEIPEGSGTDNALRSMYLKISSSADLTTTRVLTLAPNTINKLWFIENNTSGGQTITISQGSGANVSILNGQAKLIATDGAGAGAAVIDLTDDLVIKDLFVDENISMQSDGAAINFGADAEIQLTHVADTGLLLTETGGGAPTLQIRDSALSISSSADGQLDIDADTEVEIVAPTVDIDASTAMTIDTTTLTVTGNTVLDGDLTVDTDTLYVDSTNDRVGINESSPEVLMHLTDNANGAKLRLQGNGSNAIDTLLGSLEYFNNDGSSDTPAVVSSINSYSSDANGTGGYLTFSTHDGTEGGEGSDPVEAMRIDSSQRVLIGGTSARNVGGSNTALQIEGTNGVASSASIVRNTDNASAAFLTFAKSRGTSVGSDVIVQDDDGVGELRFAASDGTDTVSQLASIEARIDGTPGANDMPGRLVFSTTSDGAASTTERMRIDNEGRVSIGYAGVKSSKLLVMTSDGQVPTNASAARPALNLTSSQTAAVDVGPSLYFRGQTGNSTAEYSFGAIQGVKGSATASDYGGHLVFYAQPSGGATLLEEVMRVKNGGYVVVSSTGEARSMSLGASSARLQIEGTTSGAGRPGVSGTQNSNDASGPVHYLAKSRGTANGSNTIVQDDDYLGQLNWNGADGTQMVQAGNVSLRVDGTPGTNDMPGRLVFMTTADGANSPTERMRISQNGHMGFGETDTDDVYYTFKKSVTDYTGEFATYNLGQMDSFRFYQSATTKWAKVFARSYQTGSQFGTQAHILEIQGHGSTGGNGHHVTLHVTTKQQQSSDGYDIYATGNNGYNVAYKFDASGGHESAGLLEIWVQPQENYVTTCLWVKTSQRKGDPTSETVAWFGLEDTGSSTQPTGSTTVEQHNPFMGLHYTDGNPSGKYETSENYEAWYSRLNINRYLALGGPGTTKPTIGGSDNQIATISGASNRATLNFFQSQNGSDGAKIRFAKGRSGTVNGIGTAASNGDQTGIIINYVDDGTDLGSYSSYINFKVDGTVSSNDTPGRIEFATTADGSAASTERLQIPHEGGIIMSNSNQPVATSGTTVSFQTGVRTVSSSSNATVTLFDRSPDANHSSTGTCYVACENSGGSVQWGYIIDFFYSNGVLQTTARETGSSQGTATATIAESGSNLSITITYAGGLGGAIRFNAGGTAVNCSY